MKVVVLIRHGKQIKGSVLIRLDCTGFCHWSRRIRRFIAAGYSFLCAGLEREDRRLWLIAGKFCTKAADDSGQVSRTCITCPYALVLMSPEHWQLRH